MSSHAGLSLFSGTVRNGTCYTRSECSALEGNGYGNCAAGWVRSFYIQERATLHSALNTVLVVGGNRETSAC